MPVIPVMIFMDEYGRLIPAPNRFPSAADGCIRFGLDELESIDAGSKATELWTGDSITIEAEFTADIPAHGAKVFKI